MKYEKICAFSICWTFNIDVIFETDQKIIHQNSLKTIVRFKFGNKFYCSAFAHLTFWKSTQSAARVLVSYIMFH